MTAAFTVCNNEDESSSTLRDVLRRPRALKCSFSIELIRFTTMLPVFIERDDWIALKIVDIVYEVSLLGLVMTDFCTEHSCPRMRAGSLFDYNWVDYSGHVEKLSACDYTKRLIEWASDLTRNTQVFPLSLEARYPPEFRTDARSMFKRIFRVYSHIYLEHHGDFVDNEALIALNTSFLHMFLFGERFQLLSEQDTSPVMRVVETLLHDEAL